MELPISDSRFRLNENPSSSPPYRPLAKQHIRLLTVLPGTTPRDLQCELKDVPIDSKLCYTALSYAWGSPPAQHAIRLNGRRFLIQKNLWKFLLQARQLGGALCHDMWIDALCIDQLNRDERLKQVQMMPRIYAGASEVLVWLGPQYAASNVALSTVAQFGLGHREQQTLWKTLSSEAGPAIVSLSHRSYWTRLWIVQELSLARKIRLMCGTQVVDWDRFASFMTHIQNARSDNRRKQQLTFRNIRGSPAVSIVNQKMQPAGQQSLLDLMYTTRQLQCSELRDKVYALLGIAKAGHEHIKPDYGANVAALMNSILRNAHALDPPDDFVAVVQQCHELSSLLGQKVDTLFSLEGPGCFMKQPPEEDIESCPLAARYYSPMDRHVSVGRFKDAPTHVIHARRPYMASSEDKERNVSRFSLWWIIFYGHTAILRLMLKYDDISLPLSFEELGERGPVSALQILLSIRQMDIQGIQQLKCGITAALELAVRTGDEKQVQVLLSVPEFDVNTPNYSGYTPLECAIQINHEHIFKLLLESGRCELRRKTKMYHFVLRLAANQRSSNMAKQLLDLDPHCEIFDLVERRRCLQVAECMLTLEYLLDSPGMLDPLADGIGSPFYTRLGPSHCTFTSDYNYCSTCFTSGGDSEDENVKCHKRLVYLFRAIERLSKLHMIRRINADDSAPLPIQLAVQTDCKRIVELLLHTEDHGLNINSEILPGRTALQWAAEKGYEAVVRRLLTYENLETEIEDESGYTATRLADLGGRLKVVKLLSDSRRIMKLADRATTRTVPL